MRRINIDFYNQGKMVILGYTAEHLATEINFIVPPEFREGFTYKLVFNLENSKTYAEVFSTYPIIYSVKNGVLTAGNSGRMQLSVLKNTDNGETLIAQGDVIPFKVLDSLEDSDTNIGEYVDTISQLIDEFNSKLNDIDSRELKSNKVNIDEEIKNEKDNYPSISYLDDNVVFLKNMVTTISPTTIANKATFPNTEAVDTFVTEKEEGLNLKIDKAVEDLELKINNIEEEKASKDLFLSRSNQLFKLEDINIEKNGVIIKIKNNHFSLKGTASSYISLNLEYSQGLDFFEKDIKYTVSAQNIVNKSPARPNDQYNRLYGATIYLWGSWNSGSYGLLLIDNELGTETHTIDTTEQREVKLSLDIATGTVIDLEFDFMIEEGDSYTPFEPYYVVENIKNNSVTYNNLDSNLKTHFDNLPIENGECTLYRQSNSGGAGSCKYTKINNVVNIHLKISTVISQGESQNFILYGLPYECNGGALGTTIISRPEGMDNLVFIKLAENKVYLSFEEVINNIQTTVYVCMSYITKD